MPNIEKVIQTKNKIIELIETKGPSYPTQISRQINISPLFTAAFLSELVKEKKLKLSNMKIGSSPIYYSENQEQQLENFIDYLNHKEKEAFFKIKESKILKDESQEPAIRVALRKIKDFAIPIQVRIDGKSKLFWRYFQFPESETRNKIRQLINPSRSDRLQPPKTDEQSEKNLIESKEKLTANKEQIRDKKQFESPLEKPLVQNQEKQTTTKPKKPQTSKFVELIKDYLATKDMKVLEELTVKKKEFQAKVRIDTLFGKQEYFLTAKDKKKISQNDLTIATQNAQAERMQALFITSGELDKNAKTYLQDWRNLTKFDRIKI